MQSHPTELMRCIDVLVIPNKNADEVCGSVYKFLIKMLMMCGDKCNYYPNADEVSEYV